MTWVGETGRKIYEWKKRSCCDLIERRGLAEMCGRAAAAVVPRAAAAAIMWCSSIPTDGCDIVSMSSGHSIFVPFIDFKSPSVSRNRSRIFGC